MLELNIMHIAINGNIKWWPMEEICFAQLEYCLIILCSQTATTPSYLFNTAILDGIDYVDYVDYGHLLLRGIFAASE